MIKVKSSFTTLDKNYVFSLVSSKKKPGMLDLGVGDILLPLLPSIQKGIKAAVDEMATPEGACGYGPELGYDFLREALCRTYYAKYGITPSDILISDGIASDITLILDLFDSPKIALQNPTYPPYFETLKMQGLFANALILPCNKETGYIPEIPKEKVDLIFLCSPQNPTGVALTRKELKAFVDFAKKSHALILFDAAYQAFVSRKEVPFSIYEIEGAKDVAIEFGSFSKTAGFTGLRCGYTLCPNKDLLPHLERLKTVRTNGVAYPIQRGAEAALSLQGQKEIQERISYFQSSMRLLREGMQNLGFEIVGGIDCPYIWWKIPNQMDSLTFFEDLLQKTGIIAVPGVGFGSEGEGYMRLSALADKAIIEKALQCLKHSF